MDEALKKAVRQVGGFNALARALGIKHQSILQWQKTPASRVLQVEELSGVSRRILRPDLYPKERRDLDGILAQLSNLQARLNRLEKEELQSEKGKKRLEEECERWKTDQMAIEIERAKINRDVKALRQHIHTRSANGTS
jgi:DNA-binding transcriptional regulator YdaS (Cro superfamily)